MRLGSPVKLIGIQSRTEVNGQNGVLIDMNATGRYCIRLRSGETMAVRPECCDPILERAPSEIAVPKFDSLTKPKLNAPTIDLGALTAEAREVYTCLAGQLMGCDCARADGATPADYDPAPDGVASACHPAEPVSCGRYDGAVTKFGGWKGKRFAVV